MLIVSWGLEKGTHTRMKPSWVWAVRRVLLPHPTLLNVRWMRAVVSRLQKTYCGTASTV